MSYRFIVPLKSLGGSGVRYLVLVSKVTGRLRNRMDRRAFLYSASIESMKKESWVNYSSDT